MSCTIRKIVSVLCLAAALFTAALLPVSGYCENLRFVFMADSRSGDPTVPNPTPTDLINTPVLNAINLQILALSPRPSFVVYAGDQAYRGRYNGTYNFQAFKDVMSTLTTNGITLYTALGNHELYDQHADKFLLANQQEYQKVFKENPGNGPTGYERLVYSFPSPGGDAFFAVLDPYYLTKDEDKPKLNGTIDNTQLAWLTMQVALTKATHKFLFTHAPYYHIKTLSSQDASYTTLWSLLDDNYFDIYFCGHTHLYSRKTIDSSIPPDPQISPSVQWKNNVVQLLNGTCGAPVDKGSTYVNPILWNVHNAADTYYFSVVDISGSQVTVNSYGGNTGAYSLIDNFTINRNAAPGVDLLLLD